MKTETILAVNAFTFIGLGIAFALYGPLMITFFGIQETGGDGLIYWYVASFARLFGAALFGFGFLIWAARSLVETSPAGSRERRGLLLALLIACLMGLIVTLTQQFSVWLSPAGWIAAAIFFLLTFGYGYLLATKP